MGRVIAMALTVGDASDIPIPRRDVSTDNQPMDPKLALSILSNVSQCQDTGDNEEFIGLWVW